MDAGADPVPEGFRVRPEHRNPGIARLCCNKVMRSNNERQLPLADSCISPSPLPDCMSEATRIDNRGDTQAGKCSRPAMTFRTSLLVCSCMSFEETTKRVCDLGSLPVVPLTARLLPIFW